MKQDTGNLKYSTALRSQESSGREPHMGEPGKVKVNPYGAGTYQAEIFDLKAECQTLRTALEKFADFDTFNPGYATSDRDEVLRKMPEYFAYCKAARKALAR